MKYDDKQLRCSFCGKPQDQVRRLIAGPNVFICDECIELCQEIIDEEFIDAYDYEVRDLPKPDEIKAALDEYVIKQERAKKTLAVAVYNHYKRINKRPSKNNDVELQKSNIVMIDPLAQGKLCLLKH